MGNNIKEIRERIAQGFCSMQEAAWLLTRLTALEQELAAEKCLRQSAEAIVHASGELRMEAEAALAELQVKYEALVPERDQAEALAFCVEKKCGELRAALAEHRELLNADESKTLDLFEKLGKELADEKAKRAEGMAPLLQEIESVRRDLQLETVLRQKISTKADSLARELEAEKVRYRQACEGRNAFMQERNDLRVELEAAQKELESLRQAIREIKI